MPNKQEIDEKIMQVYLLNEELEEEMVVEKNPNFYKSVIEVYGSWENALNLNGITYNHLKERRRFIVYSIMKKRLEDHGELALKPKNIDQDGSRFMNEEIKKTFKTVKRLKELLLTWSKEKVIYELRGYLLTGGELDQLSKDNTILYKQINIYYGTLKEAMKIYKESFPLTTSEGLLGVVEETKENGITYEEMLGKVKEEKVVENEMKMMKEETEKRNVLSNKNKKSNTTRGKVKELKPMSSDLKKKTKTSEESKLVELDMLLKRGYISEKEYEEIVRIKNVSYSEVEEYLDKTAWEIAMGDAQPLTEERVKMDNLAIYNVIQKDFGSVIAAFKYFKKEKDKQKKKAK